MKYFFRKKDKTVLETKCLWLFLLYLMPLNTPRDLLSLCCSVSQSCLTVWTFMDYSTPGLPTPHHLSEFAQTHVHWVNDAIQTSHPLSYPFPPVLSQFYFISETHRSIMMIIFPARWFWYACFIYYACYGSLWEPGQLFLHSFF